MKLNGTRWSIPAAWTKKSANSAFMGKNDNCCQLNCIICKLKNQNVWVYDELPNVWSFLYLIHFSMFEIHELIWYYNLLINRTFLQLILKKKFESGNLFCLLSLQCGLQWWAGLAGQWLCRLLCEGLGFVCRCLSQHSDRTHWVGYQGELTLSSQGFNF